MSRSKYRKLWITFGLSGIVYAVVSWFYPSYAVLSCDKEQGICSYIERNIWGVEGRGFSCPIQGSKLVLAQHKHHYYTGRRVRKKTTTDYQLEIHTSEVEVPIFNATYIRHTPAEAVSKWNDFTQNATDRHLFMEKGFVGWDLGILMLMGLWAAEFLVFFLFRRNLK